MPVTSFGSKIVSYSSVKSDNNIFNSVCPHMPKSSPEKLKALIIDDETDICYLLGSILRQKNFQTVFAGSFSEAEKILREETDQSVIFLDNHLPDGLGVNYIFRLKKRYPSSIIVMITAHDTIADRERAQEQGVDFFIGKPFSKEIIFKTIEKIAQ
jgi:two-component system, OmpR family, response regulator